MACLVRFEYRLCNRDLAACLSMLHFLFSIRNGNGIIASLNKNNSDNNNQSSSVIAVGTRNKLSASMYLLYVLIPETYCNGILTYESKRSNWEFD
jgi:hypothetical protein